MLGRHQLLDGKGDRCGIYGSNCPEWITAMESSYIAGANAVEFIINRAEVSIALVQETKLPAGSLDPQLPPKQKTDICTIMYTSGTTGEPKGVILSNGAVMGEVLSIDQLLAETDKAVLLKLSNLEKGLPQDKAAPLFDKVVFDKIKQAFGGRVCHMLSGAAPLPRHVEEFLRVTCCCVLSQGYGNTFSMIRTVGVPMTTIEARLESVPEMEYDALASIPRGEICLRGSTLFSGYHKREDLTKAILVDGWFHTGTINLGLLRSLLYDYTFLDIFLGDLELNGCLGYV
ncbi:hypothetical protein LguiB_022158 [Lonicera macranthoides]